MTEHDIRWKQRLNNFSSAFSQLQEFIEKGDLNKFEMQGLIQCFEYNYELAWNVIKDFYEYQGETNIQGSKDAFRLAFSRGLIQDGDLFMDMVKSRALTTHTYNEATAEQIAHKIKNEYFQIIQKLVTTLKELAKE